MLQHPLTFILSPSPGGEEFLAKETINVDPHATDRAPRKAAETMSPLPNQETVLPSVETRQFGDVKSENGNIGDDEEHNDL
ncbi:MAG: hypothetical protein ACM3MN_02500, partial [Nitrospirota bacterium]